MSMEAEKQRVMPLPEACRSSHASLSEYLDGAVTGVEMMRIAGHLQTCPACAREFELAHGMQRALATLPTIKAPEDLNLRLRLAISLESRRTWRAVAARVNMRWENALRPLVLQASAGLAGAVALLGGILFLLGAMSAANPVMAHDEPLGAMTAPHYLYSVAGIRPIVVEQENTIVVDAAVNARGEVYDFRILSGPQDAGVRAQVVDRLLGSVFQPASVFGAPVRGHVIMTFAGVTVRG